ncbi:SGNH/GDSL hydrolase family protein [Dactylosporangium sp. NPDC051541]|uniref:SGNH/GDSL hydrolase family protein n=1 Tax=Dactylosporangium sp. NPDC051541 TaxID=3363977 RepID=UPI0037976937
MSRKAYMAPEYARYCAIGDSVVEQPGGFAELVRDALTPAAFANFGVRNVRAAEVRDVQLSAALAFRPDLAMVVCGANDAMRPGYESRADDVDSAIADIVVSLQRTGATVITVSVFVMREYPHMPGWLGAGFVRRMTLLAQRTNALAARLGTVHADLSQHPAIAAGDTLTGPDGLHGNAHSHKIAAAAVLDRLGFARSLDLSDYSACSDHAGCSGCPCHSGCPGCSGCPCHSGCPGCSGCSVYSGSPGCSS